MRNLEYFWETYNPKHRHSSTSLAHSIERECLKTLLHANV
ncbi:hypothetical protein Pint_35471 [Pistacia integerrima]|uniref:Uncharacterized protein n=1 Tax=Pistacia integerrima TaxID=434235 RepID=A0ACC0Y209_9ROSI|nr:hypothetical protein Pint_35471 [Pistacia integerrima]